MYENKVKEEKVKLAKSIPIVVRNSLISGVIAVAGWMVFFAIIELFDLNSLNVFLRLGLGLLLIVIMTKLGLKKLVE